MRNAFSTEQPITLWGKVGRIASEEVTLQLIKSKCIPVLLYGLKACPLNKTQAQSLDFVINRLFMKLFNTFDITLGKQCREQFNFTLPSVSLERRRTKFMHKLCCVDFFTWSGRYMYRPTFVCIDIALPLYFFVLLFVPLLFFVLYYHMWWIKIFIGLILFSESPFPV